MSLELIISAISALITVGGIVFAAGKFVGMAAAFDEKFKTFKTDITEDLNGVRAQMARDAADSTTAIRTAVQTQTPTLVADDLKALHGRITEILSTQLPNAIRDLATLRDLAAIRTGQADLATVVQGSTEKLRDAAAMVQELALVDRERSVELDMIKERLRDVMHALDDLKKAISDHHARIAVLEAKGR
jgi:Sec-independent protein translocase protein TatA